MWTLAIKLFLENAELLIKPLSFSLRIKSPFPNSGEASHYRARGDLFDLTSPCAPDPHTLCPAMGLCPKAPSPVLYIHSFVPSSRPPREAGNNIPILQMRK